MFAMGGMAGQTPASQAYFASHGQDPNAGWNRPNRFGDMSGHADNYHQSAAPPPQQQQPHHNHHHHHHPPARGGKSHGHGECHEECAEEECVDEDQCGNETRPPKPEQLWCGIDSRPLLPVGLSMTTVLGAICMLTVQIPMCVKLFNLPELAAKCLYIFFGSLYTVCLLCMILSALADPGQLPDTGDALISHNDAGTDADEEASDRALPKRAHKCWQYQRPVRRYDHYCRWLTNVIGMRNHREFIVMVTGLVGIGVIGICFDMLLMVAQWMEGEVSASLIFLLMHLGYSSGLTGLAGPILKIHVGLVSRNEVAHEWKKNTNYVVKQCSKGDNVEVNELSDDEFNALFESFVYDRKKNPYDKGLVPNCWTFWCTPRWRDDEMGDF